MANKQYKVREGYTFEVGDQVFSSGDTVEVESFVGDAAHQLERLGRPAKQPAAQAPVQDPVVDPAVEPAAEEVAADAAAPAESTAEHAAEPAQA